MGLFRELKVRAKQVLGPVIGVSMVVYFAYHAVQGDRGILALGQLRGEVDTLQAQVLDVRDARFELDKKVQMLRAESLDPDLLDEQARVQLGFGRADELVVIFHQNDTDMKALASYSLN